MQAMVNGHFNDLHLFRKKSDEIGEAELKDKARRYVAGKAIDAADAAHLLDVLGLIPVRQS